MHALGLGTWKSEPGEVYEAVKTAIEIGYRHIDCAFIYFNESEIGQAIQDVISSGTVKREDLWITSKLWNNAHLKDQVEPALRNTLKDLQLDYVDLYLVHWPVAQKEHATFPSSGDDFLTPEEAPIHSTWEAMIESRNKGLTRHIGVSNFGVERLKALAAKSWVKPECNQVELHPLLAQNELKAYCDAEGIHLTAYSPLGSKDRDPAMKRDNEPDLFENPVIKSIASTHGASPAQILIRWAIQRGTAVIPKSVNPGRLKQNFDAARLQLSEHEMNQINDLDKGYRFLDGSIWTMEGSPHNISTFWD